MSRRKPSLRWNREHRYKIVHRWWWQAYMHAWRINNLRDDGKRPREPYACYWGNDYRDGETAPIHWHVGRPTTNHIDGYQGRWAGYTAEERSAIRSGESRRTASKSKR